MANFTKGPWVATRVAPFSYQIATDHPHGHANYGVIVQEVRSEENALLISAAPELFEALQALLDISDFAEGSVEQDIHVQATAALWKAVNRG